ncbi:MAG: UxaA family hydrolase [Thermodesulfobacteriota bacterium]
MSTKTKIIVINEKDNVGTALETLRAGAEVLVQVRGHIEKITPSSDIPMGHKLALRDIEKGEAVIKYGERIGQSTSRISRGEYVHIHNVVSQIRGESLR